MRRLILIGLVLGAAIGCQSGDRPHPDEKVPESRFGLHPDADQDQTAALQRAFDALQPRQTLVLAPGVYRHADVLRIRIADVSILGHGATLLATREERSGVSIAADRVLIDGLTFGVVTTTRRWDAFEQMKVHVSGHTGVVLRDITVTGSAAAGIYVGSGTHHFRLERLVVRDTRADGIHLTGGAHHGLVIAPIVERSGDDGVAVVSYERDGDPCHDIAIRSPTVRTTTWGRGLSVVGGHDISYTDVNVSGSDAAAVYVAIEAGPYDTESVRGVTVNSGTITRANTNPRIDHGAIVVFSGRPEHGIATVRIHNITIRDTRVSAARQVSLLTDGGTITDVTLSDLVFRGGPARVFTSQVDPSAYRIEGWQVNGRSYAPG